MLEQLNRLTVSESGMPSRIFLAFLATAGFFYVNIMPALVDSLKVVLDFTNSEATQVGSANVYGAAAGAFVVIFVIKKLNWKTTSVALLTLLISIDLISLLVSSPMALIGIRLLHGFFGGCLTAIAFSVIARQQEPDKTFGVLLAVQFGLGGLAVMLIPKWVELFGMPLLYLTLVAFSVVSLLMLSLLGDYKPVKSDDSDDQEVKPFAVKLTMPIVLALLAIFLFQAGNMGLYAVIIGLGKFYDLEVNFISDILGIAAWIGIAGSLLVVIMSTRFGYLLPLVVGIVLTIIGNWLLIFSEIQLIFIVANVLVGITWAFVIPYMLGLISRFDSSGQMATVGGFASKMGLATGPMIIGAILGTDQYEQAVYWVVASLVVCLAVVLIPARYHDHSLKSSPEPE